MTTRRLFFLDLALLATMVLASRLALVIHELGGHAVPALLLGATKVEVRLSALGGGFVTPEFPARPGNAGMAVFALGGIALNLLTGGAAWIAARRRKSRGLAYAALLFLGVGSVAGAVVYLANGLYFGSGDPVGFAPATEDIRHVQWAWILFLPAAAAVAWFGVRHFLDFLSGHVALDTSRRRLGWTTATAALVGFCYGGLWLAVRNPRVEGSTSKWRLEREIARETERRLLRQSVQPDPPSPVPRPVPAPAVVVRPEEVAHRVPAPVGPIVLYATFLAAGIASLVRSRPQPGDGRIPPGLAIGLAALAAATAAVFGWLGE